MQLANRYNDGKVDFTYVLSAPKSLEGLARVYEFGAKKYARDNWKRGLSYLTLVASLMRHLLKFIGGENLDEESKLPHVSHILWNAQILAEMYYTRVDMDDRKRPEEKVNPYIPTTTPSEYSGVVKF